MGSNVGVKFYREPPVGSPQKFEYGNLGSRKEKQEFLREWALKHYAYVRQSKSFTKAYREVNTTRGEYLTFGGVVVKYGGWERPEGVAGARRLAAKCRLLGGKWISRDSTFSQLDFYFVLNREYMGRFRDIMATI